MFIFKALATAAFASLAFAAVFVNIPEANSTPVGTDICYDRIDLSNPQSVTKEELAAFQRCMNLVRVGVHSYL